MSMVFSIAVLKDVKTESSYLYNEIFYNDLKASYSEVIEETVKYELFINGSSVSTNNIVIKVENKVK